MKVFLSGLESSEKNILDQLLEKNQKIPFSLCSYYYTRNKETFFSKLNKVSNEILVDSGAHSFQKGKKVEWEEYTKTYANWIKKVDNNKILGYFEMDVDNIIGYEEVLKLRKILDNSSDKIIPVWHKNRGIDEFKRMCVETKGEIVAITGFKNGDIKDEHYSLFLKYAWEHSKKVHCLGMTRIKILDRTPFNYVDSSTWKQAGNFGEFRKFQDGKIKTYSVKGKYKTEELDLLNFQEFIKMSEYYNRKWSKVNLDLCF
ncbi:hypothetical protein DTQ80_14955 [Listeria monocytogenes]|nr:hypothetical protein [Listeria monocytogenes]MCQ88018.1 hypothetical protein [Listeria monocytogenes]